MELKPDLFVNLDKCLFRGEEVFVQEGRTKEPLDNLFENQGVSRMEERRSHLRGVQVGHVIGKTDSEGLDNGGSEGRKMEAMTHSEQVKGIKLEGLRQLGQHMCSWRYEAQNPVYKARLEHNVIVF